MRSFRDEFTAFFLYPEIKILNLVLILHCLTQAKIWTSLRIMGEMTFLESNFSMINDKKNVIVSTFLLHIGTKGVFNQNVNRQFQSKVLIKSK